MSQSKTRAGSGKPMSHTKQPVAPPSPPDSQMSEDDARRIDTAENEIERIVRQAREAAGGSAAPDSTSSKRSSKAKKDQAATRARSEDDDIQIAVVHAIEGGDAVEEVAQDKQDEEVADVKDDEAEDIEVEEEIKASDKRTKKSKRNPASSAAVVAEKGKRKRDSNGSPAVGSSSKKQKKEKGINVDKTKVKTYDTMGKVPSLAKVRQFRGFPSFRASMDDGTITEFKKDQAVFVLPDPETLAVKTDTPPQEAYWLALVKDIRANSTVDPVTNEWTADPSEVFVVIEWFYRVDDLEEGNVVPKKIVETIVACEPLFGWKEIVRSDHEAVISVFSCCEPVPIYYFQDDAGPDEPAVKLIDERHRLENEGDDENEDSLDPEEHPNHLHASQKNYFYRLTLPETQKPTAADGKTKKRPRKSGVKDFESLNVHCLCQKPYSPAFDHMRYCLDCTKWYHVKCLEKDHKWEGAIPELEAPNGKPPADLHELAMLPIFRGGAWGIGGNINIVSKAKEIVRAGEFDNYDTSLTLAGWDEWKEWVKYAEATLDPEKDDDLATLRKSGFKCPECSTRI